MTTQFQDRTTLGTTNSTQFIHRVIFNWKLPYHSSEITLTNDSAEQSVGSRQLSLFEPIQEHFPGFSMRITLRTKRNCTIWLLTAVRWDFNRTMEGQTHQSLMSWSRAQNNTVLCHKKPSSTPRLPPVQITHNTTFRPEAHFQHEHSTNVKLT